MPAPREPVYFLDHDGRVFLAREPGGRWRLPLRSEVPFAFHEKHRAMVRDQVVVFGSPVEKHLRTAWPWKDDLPFMDDVDGLARTAANISQTRLVAKGVLLRGDDVLLIKDSVGYYRGKWSLPGGYVDYGETPEACVVREAEEEVGVKAQIARLLRIDSQVVPTGFHFLTFHYEGRVEAEAFRLKADEVEEARWATLAEAARDLASPHSRAAVEGLLKEERRA